MAVFRLAANLGHPDPYELEKKLTARTMADWIAFDQVETIGSRLTNQLLAVLASYFANAHFKMDNPLNPMDFLPWSNQPVLTEKEKTRRDYGKLRNWAMAAKAD